MKCHTSHSARSMLIPGFTLVEMMVTVLVLSLLIATVVALSMYTTRTFCMIGNYVTLDSQSRNGSDVLGRQIRDASALISYRTNSNPYLLFTNATTGQLVDIYYTNNSALMLAQTGQTTQMLLTNCNSWTFSLYNRAPNITSTNVTFYPATNAASCKVINMTWKCSRNIMGSPMNTESVLTAQIVLRNKIN